MGNYAFTYEALEDMYKSLVEDDFVPHVYLVSPQVYKAILGGWYSKESNLREVDHNPHPEIDGYWE